MPVPVVFRKEQQSRNMADSFSANSTSSQQTIDTVAPLVENLTNMAITIKLDTDAEVLVLYNYGVFYDGGATGNVLLYIDGAQSGVAHEFTNDAAGISIVYHSMNKIVTLTEGSHTLQVVGNKETGSNDWTFNTGTLNALVFEKLKAAKETKEI